METKPIDCYFDGEPSIKEDGYDRTRNFRIDCPACGCYEVTDGVKRFYFEKHGFLTDAVKQQLSDYVKKKYNPENRAPVRLDKATVRGIIEK